MTKQMAATIAAVRKMVAISDARGAYRSLWIKACEADGIEPSSKFVVFSEGNPFQAELNQAGAKLIAAISAAKPQNGEGVCA
jgi:DNA-binding SARP family transcriptional activator